MIDHCGSSSTPVFPWDYKCDMDGNTPCQWDNGLKEVVCDLSGMGCDYGPDTRAYAVRRASNEITSFGSCDIGSVTHHYCCTITDTSSEIEIVTLRGTINDEEPISLQYQDGSTLRQMAPTHSGAFMARVYAGYGADLVFGSDTTASNYTERLFGGPGHDTMYGNGGNDEI